MKREIILVTILLVGLSVGSPLFPTLLKSTEQQISTKFPMIDALSKNVVSTISGQYSNSTISSYKINTEAFQYGKTHMITLDLQLKTPHSRFPTYEDVRVTLMSPETHLHKLWSFDSPYLLPNQIGSNSFHDQNLLKNSPTQNPSSSTLLLQGPLELSFNTNDVNYYFPRLLEFLGSETPNKKAIIEKGVTISITGVETLSLLETIHPLFSFSAPTNLQVSTSTAPKLLLSSLPSSKISVIGDRNLKAKIGAQGTLIISNKTINTADKERNRVLTKKLINDNVYDMTEGSFLGKISSQLMNHLVAGKTVNKVYKGSKAESGDLMMLPMEVEVEDERALWTAVLFRGAGENEEDWRIVGVNKVGGVKKENGVLGGTVTVEDSVMGNRTWAQIREVMM
eukprot:TRINITY_DN5477_c0_g1_i1.p1 TRINITY_DN5477_c0_g1~~TRINITY_DN5477_c0_g1_i1.p1  ORF type:complete len:409 (-),score=111.07 TRINITY_DN5477_c0_g1_i1:31-1218(-)